MKTAVLCYISLLSFSSAVSPSLAGVPQDETKQKTFRNPAMEERDEFTQAVRKGRMAAQQGDPAEAIREFRKAADLKNGQCSECFQYIGQANFGMRRYKEAADGYRQAIALKPANEADLNNALGVCLYLMEEKKVLAEAVAAFERAIELSKNKLVKVYYNLGYALIRMGKEAEGKAALAKYLELDPNSPSATEVRAIIANPRMAKERFAPGFKVKSFAGDELSLDKYRGKVVLLDFWATWCGPCRVDLPEVKNIWKKFGGDQFVIIGVSLDYDSEVLASYLKKEEINWPQYFDESGQVSMLYGV
ncbi:MAG TPA: redoxin domain-containing protein, partial [Blastocatellia bacterium]|nr:redoxin domain-containing protein [Blastocatellia bacterium]